MSWSGFRGPGGAWRSTPVQCREHPPDRSAIRARLDDGPRRLDARSQRGGLGERDVGAFQLAGRREHVRRDPRELVLRDVDDREHVERSQRGLQASRLWDGSQRVAAGDEESSDVPGFDLVDERDGRELAEHSWKLGPARRARRRRRG